MATKSATSRFARKVPVALFVAAIAMLIQGLVARAGQDQRRRALPDPHQMALLSMGRIGTPDVVELWQQKVQAVPVSVTYRTKLAGSLLALAGETGDLALYTEAEREARAAVDIDPLNESASLTLASALAGQHDFPGALELAREIIARTPSSVNARITAGDAQLELGKYDEATVVFSQLAEELPDAPSIMSRQARVAALTGHLDDAIELARRALIGAGEDDLNTFTGAFYWFQLANYLYQDGSYDAAAATLRSALEVEARHLGSIELLGKVLVAQGEFDEATALYENLLLRTDAADLRGELSKLYARDGRFDEADQQIERGLEIAKRQALGYPAERRHLIGFLADVDPAFALRLARQDLELRSDVQTYGWLAWSLLQDGKPSEALAYVKPALRVGTEDAWLLYQAGSVYAATGDVEHARELLTRALTLNPEFDLVHAQRARDLLGGLPTG